MGSAEDQEVGGNMEAESGGDLWSKCGGPVGEGWISCLECTGVPFLDSFHKL